MKNPKPLSAQSQDPAAISIFPAPVNTTAVLTPNAYSDTPRLPVTNTAFIAEVYHTLPDGATPLVCTKSGDPTNGGWAPMPANAAHHRCGPANNNYLNCSSFTTGDDGELRARKESSAACHFLLLDDLGTKVPLEMLGDLKLSWLLETSPGNYQAGLIFQAPIVDQAEVEALLGAIIDAGYCDPGASGPASRWARLPVGINGKPKYRTQGQPFECKLVVWNPDTRYTVQQLAQALKLDLTKPRTKAQQANKPRLAQGDTHNPAYAPAAKESPVVAALKASGLYKRPLPGGKHDITCPWVEEHTDASDTGAAYFEPSEGYPAGGFCCQHSHKDDYHVGELLRHLNVDLATARNRPIIKVDPGGLHDVVDAAERVLAAAGKYYQSGGIITTVGNDPTTGDPQILPSTPSTLVLELSRRSEWQRFEKGEYRRCDPSPKHVKTLFESQDYRYLPELVGFARQPFFRETDGTLVVKAGLDRSTGRYAVFNEDRYQLPEPTRANAIDALELLTDLLGEFHFATERDRAVTLSAIMTAVVRPGLATAPAFHAQASTPGSGKTYLCELIGLFAGAAPNQKVSYPTNAEEAAKMMLAVLLPGPAVVEFDDMDSDWQPYSAIKRALTADKTSDRILGASKTATVSTRALFLGSGNNVGPVRDLLRRVMTIRLEPQVQSPATLQYQGSPVARLRKDRERYVTAALTIIRAWKAAGSLRTAAGIASYGEAWSDYCRHPLIWLGVSDPVEAIVEQLAKDSDAETLARLMNAWGKEFGATPMTVRKIKEATDHNADLLDAILEFPVANYKGGIDSNKFGWLLKKNMGRIVNGRKFVRVELSERTGWALVPVEAAKGENRNPTFPPSPSTLDHLASVEAQPEAALEDLF